MASTLYDLLELSQSASEEAIFNAFQRLKEKVSGDAKLNDEDKTNRLIALREAYVTLSDPNQRARYDQRLSARHSPEVTALEVESGNPWIKPVVIAMVLGASVIGYSKYSASKEAARLERERIAAEIKQAELATKQAELDARQAREERIAAAQLAQQQRMESYQQQREIDRSYAYSEQISRQIVADERRIASEKAREQRAAEQAERQRQLDAERQLAKDRALLRQMQYENSGGGRYKY